uniref:Uncharacterized protein n=1 Tax=Arundo donax TaxID=35708 RepID=A0A0A8YIM2_ARUDO
MLIGQNNNGLHIVGKVANGIILHQKIDKLLEPMFRM